MSYAQGDSQHQLTETAVLFSCLENVVFEKPRSVGVFFFLAEQNHVSKSSQKVQVPSEKNKHQCPNNERKWSVTTAKESVVKESVT